MNLGFGLDLEFRFLDLTVCCWRVNLIDSRADSPDEGSHYDACLSVSSTTGAQHVSLLISFFDILFSPPFGFLFFFSFWCVKKENRCEGEGGMGQAGSSCISAAHLCTPSDYLGATVPILLSLFRIIWFNLFFLLLRCYTCARQNKFFFSSLSPSAQRWQS